MNIAKKEFENKFNCIVENNWIIFKDESDYKKAKQFYESQGYEEIGFHACSDNFSSLINKRESD